MPDISLFDAIRSQRAIRRFTTEAIPDDVISELLEAAIRAPSGTNKQPWYFLVIRDREIKARIGELYLDGWTSVFGDLDPATMSQNPEKRTPLCTKLHQTGPKTDANWVSCSERRLRLTSSRPGLGPETSVCLLPVSMFPGTTW